MAMLDFFCNVAIIIIKIYYNNICRWRNMKKKTHEQFLDEIRVSNPSILVLGNYVNCSTKIKVKCLKCSHIWSTVPNSLSQGHGCPVCARNQKKSHKQFLSEMHEQNPYIEILDEYHSSHHPLQVRCAICGHEWSVKPYRLLNGAQCTNCIKPHTSFMEQFILHAFQEALGGDQVEARNISTIGLELDIFIPKYKLAIEPGTWLYHESKVATHDLQKRRECANNGIRLITVYDTYPPDTAPPYKTDCYVFEGFLNEPGYSRIINFLKDLMNSYQINHNNIDWKQIANKAYSACHYNAHEMFVATLSKKQPNIEVLEKFKGTNIPITVNNTNCSHPSWKARPYTLLRGIGCPECGKIVSAQKRTRTHEQFLSEVAQLIPTVEILGKYTKVTDRISVRCKDCGHTWEPLCYSLLSSKGCPHCSAITGAKNRGNKLASKTTAQFKEELLGKNKNICVLGEYVNNKTKLLVECKICGHAWNVVPASLLNGHGCPICNRKNRRNPHD